MNAVEFMQQLENRFPAIKKDMGMDIIRLIEPLDGSQIKEIWETFLDSYEFSTPPRRAVFVKIMGRLGINRSSYRGEIYYYYCEKCGMGYPVTVNKCQVCGKELALTKGRGYPPSFVKMHQACATCKKFVPFQTIGSSCEYWGRSSEEWGLNGVDYNIQLSKCNKCECRICCRAQRIYNTDYSVYKSMIDNGELEGGWEKKRD